MMKNQMPHSIDLNLTEFESERNFNQSSNQRYQSKDNRSAGNSSWIERGKKFIFYILILLILCPILFILVGMIYRNNCSVDSNLTFFLTIFGVLILLNVFVYTIVGSTFFTLLRRIRSIFSEKNLSMIIGTIFSIFIGSFLLIWWIIGIIWWIEFTWLIHQNGDLKSTFCHPIVYWTSLFATIFGLIGFTVQICISIDDK